MKPIWKWINNLKLQTKMVIIYVVIGFFPLLILFFVFYVQMQNILIDKDTTSIQAFLYEGTDTMDNQILIYDNLSNYISFNQTVSQVVSYKYETSYEKYSQIVSLLDPMLASLKYFHDDLNQVTIYMENEVIQHDTTLAPLTEIQNELWYQDVLKENMIKWYIDAENKNSFSARCMPTISDF